MSAYEQFRDELLVKLAGLDKGLLCHVMSAVDAVADRYTMEPASRSLTVFNGELPDVCKAYLVSRSIEGVANSTIGLYKTVLRKFFRTIGKPLTVITSNDIRLWLFNYEQSFGVSKRTMNEYRQIIDTFFCWAVTQGWMENNPCAKIKPIKYPKKPRKAMDQLGLQYMREACRTEQEMALVELMYSTGCRVSQLSHLKKSDINWDRKQITVLGKGSKYHTVYMNAKLIIALNRYFAKRSDDSEYVIVTQRAPHHPIAKGGLERIVRIIYGRVKEKLNVPVTPHVFRHTTATIAMQNGMPVQDVQAMLGHASIGTTMIYAQVSKSQVKSMHAKCVV